MKGESMKLIWDADKYEEKVPKSENANQLQLQVFITNRCNKRCKDCFYDEYLGKEDMDFEYYKDLVDQNRDKIKKVILLGGEPSIHPKLHQMIDYNWSRGLKTTIYTNGTNMHIFEGLGQVGLNVRVGILGLTGTQKNLKEVKQTDVPFMTILIARPDTTAQLMQVVDYAENYTNSTGFMLSSIRNPEDFWVDTPDTLTNQEYANIAYDFLKNYKGNLPTIHICRRAVIDGATHYDSCRYLNVYPNGKKTICPLDIYLDIMDGEGYEPSTRVCNKHHECILQKITLKKRIK